MTGTRPPRTGWGQSLRRGGLFLAAAASLGMFLGAQIRIDSLFADRGAGYRLLYLPSGKYLKIASLGFSQLWADVIYLWSIQFYSEPMNGEGRDYLQHIFGDVLAGLDPHFLDPYLTGALTMASEAGDVQMALKLLEKGMDNNPASWILPADAGFYAYLNLHDLDLARAYFRRAMEIPGAPPVLSRLHAGMLGKLGDDNQAHRAWLEIYQQAQDDYTRQIAYRHVHDLKIDLDLSVIRRQVAGYQADRRGFPASLNALVRTGRLAALPVDPGGLAYRYDPPTGRVWCDTPYELRRQE